MSQEQDRTLPPRPLRIANENGSSVFLSTDGTIYRKYYDPSGVGYGSHPLTEDQARKYLDLPSTSQRIAQAWVWHDQAVERTKEREALVLKACTELAQGSGTGADPEQLRTLLRDNSSIELLDGAHLELRTPDQELQWVHVSPNSRRETIVTGADAAALLSGHTLADLNYNTARPKVRAAQRALRKTLGIGR